MCVCVCVCDYMCLGACIQNSAFPPSTPGESFYESFFHKKAFFFFFTASMKLTLQGPFAMGVLRQPLFQIFGSEHTF